VWQQLFARKYWGRWLALCFWLSLIGSQQWYMAAYDLTPSSLMENVITMMKRPVTGPLLYILFYTIQPVILFPTWLLTVAAGFLYGIGWGTAYTVVAANLSAIFSYLIGRYFALGLFDVSTARGLLQRYANYLREHTFEAVLVLRLLYLPYDLLSYVAGFLRIPWRPFLLGTIIGSIPGTISFILFGTSFTGTFTDANAPAIDWRMLLLSALMFIISIGLSRLFRRRA